MTGSGWEADASERVVQIEQCLVEVNSALREVAAI